MNRELQLLGSCSWRGRTHHRIKSWRSRFMPHRFWAQRGEIIKRIRGNSIHHFAHPSSKMSHHGQNDHQENKTLRELWKRWTQSKDWIKMRVERRRIKLRFEWRSENLRDFSRKFFRERNPKSPPNCPKLPTLGTRPLLIRHNSIYVLWKCVLSRIVGWGKMGRRLCCWVMAGVRLADGWWP